MKHAFARGAAAALLTAALALAPAAAQANTNPGGMIYPPADACQTSSATVAPGGAVSFGCDAGTFAPRERVTVTVTGENGSAATIGHLRSAITTLSGAVTATSSGSLPPFSVQLPANAIGTYVIEVFSASSSGGSATVSVAAPLTPSEAGGGSGTPDSLPATGSDAMMILITWVAGGALLLAGGALVVAGTVRRSRRTA